MKVSTLERILQRRYMPSGTIGSVVSRLIFILNEKFARVFTANYFILMHCHDVYTLCCTKLIKIQLTIDT